MSRRIALELNDTGITASDGESILLESPGYIIDSGNQTWIGQGARERALLYSNGCNNKFWSEIASAANNSVNQEAIRFALRHLADIWKHVSSEVSTVVLIVPGTFTKTGLGLLLGMCKQLEIPVQAMVHQAVLCPYQSGHQGDTIHVDIQLHHTAVTPLKKNSEEFAAGETTRTNTIGLISIYAKIAEFIAQEFIKKTRLDPIHSAELEQQLHNHLPTWLAQSQASDTVTCQLNHKNNSFQVTINSDELHTIYEPLINNIIRTIQSTSSEDLLIACIPERIDVQFGFTRYAHKQGVMVRSLSAGHYAKQSFAYNEEVLSSDGQVYLNKQLPYVELSDVLTVPADGNANNEKPSHILFDHRAYSISEAIYFVQSKQGGFELQYDKSDASNCILTIHESSVVEFEQQQNVAINDQKAQSLSKLSIGDRIQIDTCEDVLILIKVES